MRFYTKQCGNWEEFSDSHTSKVVSSAQRPVTKQLAVPIFDQHIYIYIFRSQLVSPALLFQPCRIHPRSSASAPAEPRRSTLFSGLNRNSLLHIVVFLHFFNLIPKFTLSPMEVENDEFGFQNSHFTLS